MSKVFRVLISETQGFYVDIEATSPQDAMHKVRVGLGDNDVVPIEDDSAYTGYQVDDAMEIPRENSDLA